MKKIFPLLFLSLIYGKAHSQITPPNDFITSINKILSENWKGSGIQRVEADRYGNLVFYSTSESFWFNLNNVIGFDENEFFLFPSAIKIRCSSDSCGEQIILIGNKVYSTWGKINFSYLQQKWRSVIIKEFNELQKITKDPFRIEQ